VYIFLLFAVTHINKCFDWTGIGAIIRRQSLARLHSMAIEGPITKVINIITAAQESSPNYISQALDKVYIASL
jgi:p-aminobenzoyl-glutamate transporter AbgT